MFTLTFTGPEEKRQSRPLEDGELLVGRDAGCDVVLASKDVSRRHARFFVRGGALLVEDLGSHNGVFVRGARIAKPLQVSPGAAVEIGDVHVSVAAASAAQGKAGLAPEEGRASAARGVGAGAALRAIGSAKHLRLPARAVVGRAAGCEVVLDDDSVSRRHAELARDHRGLYRLRDLESGNGTLLDGKPVGKEPQLVPEGARLRFGDVELVFCRRPAGLSRAAGQKILVAALGALSLGAAMAIVLRAPSPAAVAQLKDEGPDLVGQARAALENGRFDDAARLLQQAIDQDPLAAAPRRLLLQTRREQQAEKALGEALAKAQVGREEEALQLLAQVSPESRSYPPARVRAKDLAGAVLRTRGAACRGAPRGRPREVAEQCALALDIKCQQGSVEGDPMLQALRAAEKALSRKIPWTCPSQLAPLLREEGRAPGLALTEQALRTLHSDPPVRRAVLEYARGDVKGALRALAGQAAARRPGAAEAAARIKVADGRFREGQTALMAGALDRADLAFREALQADEALLPGGAVSFLGGQIRSTLSRAHAKAGDDKLQRQQYASAFDEYQRGLAADPHDPHLLDQLARLEKVAESIVGNRPSCRDLEVAAHITQRDPPSAVRLEAQKSLERCR